MTETYVFRQAQQTEIQAVFDLIMGRVAWMDQVGIRQWNTVIGGGSMTVIAGPCSVESEEQNITVAESVKRSGAQLLRGGAFKPRTSPYAFQGLRNEGIRLLLEAKKATEETASENADSEKKD